jgi:hypothetical protein
MIWGFSVVNPDLVVIFSTMPFAGFEVFLFMLIAALVRLFLFRGR